MTASEKNRAPAFLIKRQRNQRMMLLGFTLLLFLGFCGLIGFMIYKKQQQQQIYMGQFGDDWRQHYEERNGAGSLDRAHQQIIMGFAAMPVVGIILLLIYRQGTVDRSGGYSLKEHRKKYKEPERKW